MAVKNTNIGGTDFVDYTGYLSVDFNDTFNAFYNKLNAIKSQMLVPIGTIMCWCKTLTGVPSTLTPGWVECDGVQKTVPSTSPYADGNNHFTPPNLNVDYFLYGWSGSGSYNSAGAHSHTLGTNYLYSSPPDFSYLNFGYAQTTGQTVIEPPFYTVVYIMRVA